MMNTTPKNSFQHCQDANPKVIENAKCKLCQCYKQAASYLNTTWCHWGWTILQTYRIKKWHRERIKQEKRPHQCKHKSNWLNMLTEPQVPFPNINCLTRTKISMLVFQIMKQCNFSFPIIIPSRQSPPKDSINTGQTFWTSGLIIFHFHNIRTRTSRGSLLPRYSISSLKSQ